MPLVEEALARTMLLLLPRSVKQLFAAESGNAVTIEGGLNVATTATTFDNAGEAMADRRESAINDPRFWVSVTAVLLTLTLCALTLAVNKLGSIDTAVQAIRDSTTRQGEKIEGLERQVGELKVENKDLRAELAGQQKRQTDYNFNLSQRLTEIEVMLKQKGK